MPWQPSDAQKHVRSATSSKLRRLWVRVANETLARTGDDAIAIREANAAVDKARCGRRHSRSRWV